MTAASDPDILAGVERWARVRGFVMHSRTGYDRNWKGTGWGIHVNPLPPGGSLLIVPDGVNELMGVEVPPALALAWALLVETDASPVDVGRCPACEGEGWLVEHEAEHEHDSRQWEPFPRAAVEARRIAARPRAGSDSGSREPLACPACNGTGRETIPVARLLLDAATNGARSSADGKSIMRDADRLLVHADHLQAASAHGWGEMLAWALGPWSGEPKEPVWHPAWAAEVITFGHPHTAAALRWLEWLTWGRELIAGQPRREWHQRNPHIDPPIAAAARAVVERIRGAVDADRWTVTRFDVERRDDGPGVRLRATYHADTDARIDAVAIGRVEGGMVWLEAIDHYEERGESLAPR